jgi:uncharacterized protein (TIGR02246 family)
MRTVLTAVFIVALVVPGVTQSRPGSGDEAAIRKVVQQLDDARNAGNWKGVSGMFTDDADQRTSTGEWRRGHAEIEKGIAQSMATPTYKGATFVTTIEQVRMLTPTVAVADGPFDLLNIPGGGARHSHVTYVLVKSSGQWRIAVSRSMVNTPAGATAPR